MAAMLTAGVVSCGKDDGNDNGSGNGGNGGGGNPGGGGTTTGEWVDLGLPSGLLWAKCNLGANAPEEYGDYYAWGETVTKSTYNWSTYRYCLGDNNNLTKYCNSGSYGHNGYTDTLTVLQAMDDAATAALGNGVRMPTKADWEELIANTTRDWTTQNGVYGRKFTASNGNTLFLPAAGYRCDSEHRDAGYDGYYWSSSLYESSPGHAWYFFFNSGCQYLLYDPRFDGRSVRPVRSAQ